MALAYTKKLNIKRIDEKDYFADEAFNQVIDDMDNKLVGISHLSSAMHWIEWQPSIAYSKDDIIRYKALIGGQYAKCITAGVSGTTEPTNNVTNSKVTDGTVEWLILSLADLLFDSTKISIWLSSETYHRGQLVMYNNCLYRCKAPHTSDTSFDLDASKWQEIKASIGMWKPLTYYYADDVIVKDKLLYMCKTPHVSANTFTLVEEANWELICIIGGIVTWQSNEIYMIGQIISYNGLLYKANTKHTSTTNFVTDIANWDILNAGLHMWSTGVYYPSGMVVVHNKKIYQCISSHTSNVFTVDISNWDLISALLLDWISGVYYDEDEFISYDNTIYRCLTAHVSGTGFSSDIANWQEIKASVRMWHPSIYYYQDDVVVNDKKLYICTTAHTSASTFTPAEEANWEILSGGGSGGITDWAVNTPYEKGQVVRYQNILYLCMSNHTSSNTDISADITNWVLLYGQLNAWESGVYYPQRATVMYNQGNGHKVYTCNVAHTSTSFATDALQKWSVIASNITVWQKDTFYDKGEVVLHEGILYHCKTSHVSDWSSFVTDFTTNNYWETISNHQFVYKKDTFYAKDSIVEYRGKLYKALKDLKGQQGFDWLHWQPVSRTLEEWSPFINNTDFISLVNFEEGQYNLYFEGKGSGLAFEDVSQNVQYYIIGGYPDTAISVHNPGYLGGYAFVGNVGSFANATCFTPSLSPYTHTIDFTFDCAVNFNGNSLSINIFGASIIFTNIIANQWSYITCVYDSSNDTIDYWLDGNYIGNIIVNYLNTDITLPPAVNYDNLRVRVGKVYTTGTNFNISTDKAEFDLAQFRNYAYSIGDFIYYQGAIYKCIEEDADSTFDSNKWELVADRGGFVVPNWTSGYAYVKNMLVVQGNNMYRCIINHVSGTDFTVDLAANKWVCVDGGGTPPTGNFATKAEALAL